MYNFNELSSRIDSYDLRARYDAACKRLLANRQILARILKACVSEFFDCDVGDIEEKYIEGTPEISVIPVHQDAEFIEGMNTEDASELEGTVYYDIRFYAISPVEGGLIRLIINVEAQNSFNPGYPIVKRGIYYGSRMISAQRGTVFDGQHYEKIEKVYSIWICPDPPAKRRNSICEYSFTEKVHVGSSGESKANYDLMTVMMVCLGGPDDDNYSGVIKMLDVLLSDRIGPGKKKKVLNDEFDIRMTSDLDEEAMDMCNLSEGVFNRGFNSGFNDGTDSAVVSVLTSMRQKTDKSIEECLYLMGIPEEKYETYTRMIEEKMGLQPV